MVKKMTMRDRVRQKAMEKKDKGSKGKPYLKLPDGMEEFKPTKETHFLDVIPYIVKDKVNPDDAAKGELWPYRRIFVHANVGTEEKRFLCPLKNRNKPCPICEYSKKRKDEGAEYAELKNYRPKERWLLNVIDVGKDGDGNIRVWDVSDYPFGQKLNAELTQEEEDYGDFAELSGGLTMKLRFIKKKFDKNDYLEVDKLDFTERKKDYKESILDKVACLDDILVYNTYEQIDKAFIMGEDPEEEEEESASDELPSDEVKKPRRPKPKPEPEEEEEEEETEEEEEDPTPPKKPSRKPLRKPKPEPEEEEEEEEEDDD